MYLVRPDGALPLKGFYRVRAREPGFAVPVFESDGRLLVQRLDERGDVDGFVACEVGTGPLLAASTHRGTDLITIRTGSNAFYAFERPDGTLIYGSRDELLPQLRSLVPALLDRPFLSLEVAQFLGDA